MSSSEDVSESQVVNVGDVGLGSSGPVKTHPLLVSSDGKVEEKGETRDRHELGEGVDVPFKGESIAALVLASAELTVEDLGGHEHDVESDARLHRCRVERLQSDQRRAGVSKRGRRLDPDMNQDEQTRSIGKAGDRRCSQRNTLGSAKEDWSTTRGQEGKRVDLPMKYVIETSDLPAHGEIHSLVSLGELSGNGEGTYEYVL